MAVPKKAASKRVAAIHRGGPRTAGPADAKAVAHRGLDDQDGDGADRDGDTEAGQGSGDDDIGHAVTLEAYIDSCQY